MIARGLLVAALLAGGAAWSADEAGDDPCRRYARRGAPEGPVALGYAEADIGVGRRVCPRTELGLGVRAGAALDFDDFYGALGGALVLSGSWAQAEGRELFATLEAVRYHWVTNAVIVGSELSLGQLTVGATQRTFTRPSVAGAASARLLLPTGTGVPGVWVVGAEVGHGVHYRPHAQVEVHGYAAVDVSAGLSRAESFPRLGGVVLAGVQYSPWRAVGFALDLSGRAGWTTSVAPSLAVRVGGERLGAELAVTRPLFGSDRSTALVGLRVGYRPAN